MQSIIVLSSGVAGFSLLLLYYLRLSLSFVGKPTDKIYYYLSCCACTFPLLIYIIQLVNYYIANSNPLLQYFYIEWLFTTPILIIKLGQIATIQLSEYILLLFTNEFLFITGYVFNITQDRTIAIVFFILAAVAYMGIIGRLIYKYRALRDSYDILTKKTTKSLICVTMISWSMYPVISVLYKFNTLAYDDVLTAYIALDFISKGIFTLVLIGTREIIVRRHSALTFITRKALRIAPEHFDTETSIATSSVDEFCRKVDIDDERVDKSTNDLQ